MIKKRYAGNPRTHPISWVDSRALFVVAAVLASLLGCHREARQLAASPSERGGFNRKVAADLDVPQTKEINTWPIAHTLTKAKDSSVPSPLTATSERLPVASRAGSFGRMPTPESSRFIRPQRLASLQSRGPSGSALRITATPPSSLRTNNAAGVTCSPRNPCTPPQTWRSLSPPPFDAPVRFGGNTKIAGETYWLWLKDGESTTACTAAQRAERGAYGRACARAVGDPLYMTQPFASATVRVSSLARAEQRAFRVECPSPLIERYPNGAVNETYDATNSRCITLTDIGDATRWDINTFPANKSFTMWKRGFTNDAAQEITLPVPTRGARDADAISVIVTAVTASEKRTRILELTRVADLPTRSAR